MKSIANCTVVKETIQQCIEIDSSVLFMDVILKTQKNEDAKRHLFPCKTCVKAQIPVSPLPRLVRDYITLRLYKYIFSTMSKDFNRYYYIHVCGAIHKRCLLIKLKEFSLQGKTPLRSPNYYTL